MFDFLSNNNDLQRRINYLLDQLEKSEQNIKELKSNIDILEEKNQELKIKEPVVVTKTVRDTRVDYLELEVSNLRKTNENLDKSNQSLRTSIQSQIRTIDSQSKTIAAKSNTISHLEQHQPGDKDIKELEERILLMDKREQELIATVDECNSYVRQVDNTNLQLINQIETLKENLDRERENNNKDKLGPLKELQANLQKQEEEEKKVKSDHFYKVMNQRIHKDVPNVKRILSHILHPATEPLRSNDDGIGIFFVETNDGKIIRVHESMDRQIYGQLPRIHEHDDLDDALQYCSYLIDMRGYYSNQDLDERFPKGSIPTEQELGRARKDFIRWKDRGAVNQEVKEEA